MHKIKIPQIKIVKPIGLKISKMEKPIFLIDINSLFDIKFLYKNAIDITTIKGIVSLITEGNLRTERYKKEYNLLSEVSIILEISKILIKIINTEIITVFINKYFKVNLDKYLFILLN